MAQLLRKKKTPKQLYNYTYILYHIQCQYLLVRKAVNTAHWLKLPKIILFSPIFQLTIKCLNVKQDLQTALCSLGCLTPLPLQPHLTNPIWLRLRNSANPNRRKQKCKRKVHCLLRNDWNGETNRQVLMRCAAHIHCTFHKYHLLIVPLLAIWLC